MSDNTPPVGTGCPHGEPNRMSCYLCCPPTHVDNPFIGDAPWPARRLKFVAPPASDAPAPRPTPNFGQCGEHVGVHAMRLDCRGWHPRPDYQPPAASPAQEATPPRETLAALMPSACECGEAHPPRWNCRKTDGGDEVCRALHDKSQPCEWEPWPSRAEASAPEPAERLKAALNEYARVLETAGAGQDAEHARAAIGFALSITEWVAFLATVAALTAERDALAAHLDALAQDVLAAADEYMAPELIATAESALAARGAP